MSSAVGDAVADEDDGLSVLQLEGHMLSPLVLFPSLCGHVCLCFCLYFGRGLPLVSGANFKKRNPITKTDATIVAELAMP